MQRARTTASNGAKPVGISLGYIDPDASQVRRSLHVPAGLKINVFSDGLVHIVAEDAFALSSSTVLAHLALVVARQPQIGLV